MAEARRFTRRTLEAWGADELVDSASLIVSELVTNAVVHTGTPTLVSLALRGPHLRIEVEDQHPARKLPVMTAPPEETSEHGRGLVITTSLSTAWGVEYTKTAKRVWVMCERDGTAPDAAPVEQVAHSVLRTRVGVVELSDGGVVTGWNDDAVDLFGWTAEEVAGRPYADLVDRAAGGRLPDDLTAPGAASWQGTYSVACSDGSSEMVFASHTPAAGGPGSVALVVAEEQRALLEHPAPSPRVVHSSAAALGLREDALVRLSVEEYLMLAAERIRDPVTADATYVLLSHDFDDDFEVVAVSGLSETLLGTRLAPDTPGTPDLHNTALPVVVPDLGEFTVPLLAGTELRSLVVVPLVMEGSLVGAVGAASVVTHGFSDDEAAVLQQFADTIALTADRARLQASERERRGWLSYIADAGDLLAGSLDQDMTMAITGQIVVPRIAQWCAIHLADERDEVVLQQVWHEDEQRNEQLRAALETVEADDLVKGSVRIPGYSATSIPLVARGRRTGYLTIGRPPGEVLRSEFFLVAESIARRAALAIDNARAHGALQATGRALQNSLLPAFVPTVPGLDVGVVYEAAGEDTAAGGDFYDLFPLGNGTWCFAVGDVCGTGAEAAAVTGLARHTIEALMRTGLPLTATVERLNTAILDEGPRARFLTLVCGTLRLDSGRVRLEIVNAGHPPPYLVDDRGGVREIGTPQTLLGVVDRTPYFADSHVLDRGDLLVAVTDGVLERRAGSRMLGEEGFAEELSRTSHLPAQAVADRIRRLVADFSEAPQHDDMAILALRVQAGPPAPAPA
ncbi:SpoIIE family protein phosphatase [Nocardioides koreensis]|uniref:SpoIIE family protein phosphatase n=1 Tax=Nocardioides koreensis TaxID=433651 RepID=A0ABN3A1P1_9ACTN